MTGAVRTVGRYEILRVLGRGGMAVVYLARQTDLGRLVALKELGAFRAGDPELMRRFVRESQLASSLAHANIVMVHDYFEHDGVPFITMEFVERGSLRPYLGRLTMAQIAGVLDGVLAGLRYASERHVVHRDIKPENVMVSSDGRVKVADFGIARATGGLLGGPALTMTGMTVGTPSYMAPEQALAGEIGPWTDMYSVGVMAYEMLLGRLPIPEASTPALALLQLVNEPIVPPHVVQPDLDPGIAGWLERMLQKDPRERFQDAAEAWDELEEHVIELLGPRWRRVAPLLGVEPGEEAPAAGAGVPPGASVTAPPAASPTPPARVPGRAADEAGAPAAPGVDDEFETFKFGGRAEAEPAVLTPPGSSVPEPPARPPPPWTPPPGRAVPPLDETWLDLEPTGSEPEPDIESDVDPEPEYAPEPDADEVAAPLLEAEPAPSPAANTSDEAETVLPLAVRPRTTPAPSSEPAVTVPAPRRFVPAMAAIALLALAALGGFAMGGAAGEPEPAAVAALSGSVGNTTLGLRYPAGWRQVAAPAIPGLELTQPIAVDAGGAKGKIVAGILDADGPLLVPASAVEGTLPESEAVVLGKLQARRYRDVRLTSGAERATLYAVPTDHGVATVACLALPAAAAGLAADCDRVASSLTLLDAKAYPLGPSIDYAHKIDGVLKRLASARTAAGKALRVAKTPSAQASAAGGVQRAYQAALRALAPIAVSPADAPAHRRLTGALKGAQEAFGDLAGGARRRSAAAYSTARASATRAARRLDGALTQLKTAGYEVE